MLDTQVLIHFLRCQMSCTEQSSLLRSSLLLCYKPLAYKEDSVIQIDISVRDTHMIAGFCGRI